MIRHISTSFHFPYLPVPPAHFDMHYAIPTHLTYNSFMGISTYKKVWRTKQKELRSLLETRSDHEKAVSLFNEQHSVLHSRQALSNSEWSYEDLIFDGLNEKNIRVIPEGFEHSIAWILWHMARIEDASMNILVAGLPQILNKNKWFNKLEVPYKDCGFAMTPEGVMKLSKAININNLREYRSTVSKKTQEIMSQTKPEDMGKKVDPLRIQRVMDEGVVNEAGSGLLKYWGNQTIAGILLMPPTRHCLNHLNECLKIKNSL